MRRSSANVFTVFMFSHGEFRSVPRSVGVRWVWMRLVLLQTSLQLLQVSSAARARTLSRTPDNWRGARAGGRAAAASRLKFRETTGLSAEETWAVCVLIRDCSLICPVRIISISFTIVGTDSGVYIIMMFILKREYCNLKHAQDDTVKSKTDFHRGLWCKGAS